ncbi:MAG: hypothetical protein RBS84_05995 [Kiritimatiellia bacterium]|nr:hypothetical protein [Kiritimatiellia bacterium]
MSISIHPWLPFSLPPTRLCLPTVLSAEALAKVEALAKAGVLA